MFRVIVAYLLFVFLRCTSALGSERNMMRSESKTGKRAAQKDEKDEKNDGDDGDEKDDASEHDDEHDSDESDASLMELGSEADTDEDHRHKDGSEFEEGELEDEGEEGDDSGEQGDDDKRQHSGNKDQEIEGEEEGEGAEDDDAMWIEDVHYIAGPVLQEFEDIRRDGRKVTAEHITQLLSEESLKKLSENETMFGLKLVNLPEDAHTMGFDEFIEHASPAKFVDLVLKSKDNYTGTDADPGVLTLAQFRARDAGDGEHDRKERKEHGAHGERGELDEAEGEGEDMHFLPESTYKSLESLSLSKTHITKEALEEILSDDRLHSLPDAEAIVQLRIEDCKEPLPELLNKVEPAAFLDKVVKGKAAVSDPKNLTLGELRKFQAEDEQSMSQEDENEGDNDGDHQDDGGRDSKVDASTKKNKKKDNRAHDDEKNKDSQTETQDHSDESQQSANTDPKAAEIEKRDQHTKEDDQGAGNKDLDKSDDSNPDSVTS